MPGSRVHVVTANSRLKGDGIYGKNPREPSEVGSRWDRVVYPEVQRESNRICVPINIRHLLHTA
jgi:hypothetical protein